MIHNHAIVTANRLRTTREPSQNQSDQAKADDHDAQMTSTWKFDTNRMTVAQTNKWIASGASNENSNHSFASQNLADTAFLNSSLTEAQLADIIARETLPADTTTNPSLEKVTQQFKSRFAGQAANKEQFHQLLKKSFGDKYDVSKAESIRQQTLKGDFSWMPKIEVRSSRQLADTSVQQQHGIALGAYSKSNDTIYLSSELLQSNPAKAEKILSEEIGHALDARINKNDAAGDEGAIFSKYLHGESMSASELNALRSENDKGVIEIDGKKVEVEYGLLKKIGRKIKKGFKKVGKTVKKGFKKLRNGVKKIGRKIKKGLSKAWKKIKKVAKKILTSKWLGAVLKIASFIPGIGAFAAIASTVLSYAQAAYGVYQGIKHKSLAAALGGVASLAGGAAGALGKMGVSGSVVNGLQTFSNYAGKASQAYAAIKSKDVGALAGMAAGIVGKNTDAGKLFTNVAKADAIYDMAKAGDTFGAISAGAGLLQDFTGDKADKTLQSIARRSTAFSKLQVALENRDFTAAYSAANEAFGDKLNLDPAAKASVEKLTSTLDKLKNVQQLYQSKDYLGAGQSLINQLSALSTDKQTQKALADIGQALVKVDAASKAANEQRYSTALSLAADALGAPLDQKTRAFLTSLQTRANQAVALGKAVKAGDLNATSVLLNNLNSGATDGLSKRLGKLSGGVDLARALANAIDDKNYTTAAGVATELAARAAGKDSDLAITLGKLSNLLSGKIQISLGDIFDTSGRTPGINPAAEAA